MKPQAPLPEQIIYLVDDDEALRDSLVWLLESQGFKVEAFASAEAFLRAWRPEFNGCLLLDVRMPGMSGLELHERLRAHYCTLPGPDGRRRAVAPLPPENCPCSRLPIRILPNAPAIASSGRRLCIY